MGYESDNIALDRIRICKKELQRLEDRKDSMIFDDYSKAKDALEYELNCWYSQLEFGTANAWYL
jgi:hypothetical protein